MTAPGHSSLRAAGGGTVGWDESLHDLKIHWAGFGVFDSKESKEGARRHHPAAAAERRRDKETAWLSGV